MSETWYYYFENGKSVGPLSLAGMIARVREGTVHSYQLVFRDGLGEWRPALAFDELRAELLKSKPSRLKQDWVVLKNEGGKFSVESLGPFRTEDVQKLILEGKIRYTDYAWKEGMQQWRRISVIKDFQAEEKPKITPEPLFDIGSPEDEFPARPGLRELLKNVQVAKRAAPPPPPVKDERPTEATGEDLTKVMPPLPKPPEASERRKKKRSKTPIPVPPPPSVSASAPAPAPAAKPSSKREKEIPKWAYALPVIPVVIAVAVKFGPHFFNSQPVVAPPPPPPPAISAPVVTEAIHEPPPPPPLPEPPPKPKPKPPHPATRLRVHVENHGGRFAGFRFDTDAGPEQTIFVEVIGSAGQVVGTSHYYRKWKWSSNKPAITDDDLPAGYFRVHAWSGEVSVDEHFESGTQDRKFAEALRAQRKFSSYDYWSERKQLLTLARRAARALGRPKIDASELDRLSGFQPSTYAFFDSWNEFRDICRLAKRMDAASAHGMMEQFQIKISQLSIWH